uniref:Reverse transcriptase domain-containing protein n=1 Tax=Strigamia maritima TaxID=126957 RepID=T1ITH0_STRMM
MRWNIGETSLGKWKLYCLKFADDVAMLAESVDGLQAMITDLERYVVDSKLIVNIVKSKVVVFRRGGRWAKEECWQFMGQSFEVVNSFKYLGFIFSTENARSEHRKERTAKASKVVNKIWGLAKRAGLQEFGKMELLFDLLVLSVVSYGVEVWGLCAYEMVERVQGKFFKMMTGLDRNTPEYIWRMELGRPSIVQWLLRCLQLDLSYKQAERRWCKDLEDLLRSVGSLDLLRGTRNNAPLETICVYMEEVLTIEIEQDFQNCWSRIDGSSYCPYYKDIKLTIGREAYLSVYSDNSNKARKMAFIKKKKNATSIIKSDKYGLYGEPGFKRVLNSGKGFNYNLLWLVVISFSICACSHQIYDRLDYLLSRPIDTKVTVTRNTSVKFPSFTLCPAIGNYRFLEMLRMQKELQTMIPYCESSALILLNPQLNISTLWDLMTLNGTLTDAYVVSRADVFWGERLFISPTLSGPIVTKTVFGSCFTYSLNDLLFYRKNDFGVRFYFQNDVPLCQSIATLFQLHDIDDIINFKIVPGFQLHLPNRQLALGLTAKRFKILNREKQPCDTIKVVSECELKCIENALKNSTHCRLPFTSLFELPLCLNVAEAIDAYIKALKLAYTFDYLAKCNCSKICDEIVYTQALRIDRPETSGSYLTFIFDDNVIEEIEEYYCYTFIPFICDAGGNLGLFLGLSILAVFELGEKIIMYFIKKLKYFKSIF